MKRDGLIIFEPRFKALSNTQISDDIGRTQAVLDRAYQKGKNSHTFYTSLYGVLKTENGTRGKKVRRFDPKDYGLGIRSFSPDSLKVYEKGVVYGEVKVSQYRRSNYLCNAVQVKNYCQYLLTRLEEGDELPGVNYGFFRYGTREDYHLLKCEKDGKRDKDSKMKHDCDTSCLCLNASNKTLDLSIIPINLFLGFLSSVEFAGLKNMNHTTSQSPRSYERTHVLGGSIGSSLFRRGVNKVGEIKGGKYGLGPTLEETIDPDLYKMLKIGSLRIVRYETPANLVCRPKGTKNQYEVKPFQVARFEMDEKSERQWLKNFKSNFEEILLKCLGIRDIEADQYEDLWDNSDQVPF